MDPAGTHLPVLQHLIGITTGPVLEMGMGFNSTPILHELCKDRLLISLDSQTEWVEKFADFRSSSHKIRTESDWDSATHYLQSVFWDVVLIDHWPCERRIIDIQLLMHNTRFMVVHDTEGRAAHCYNYEPTLSLFRYRWEYQGLEPYTTVVSMTDPIPMYMPTPRKVPETQISYSIPQAKLSILIATLDSRAEVRAKLIAILNAQCGKFPGAVEIIESSDNGDMILGDKRNLLLNKASGEYVVFVDDDDMVADTYIEDILTAIDENHPDCVTFKGLITKDGKDACEFRFDMNYTHNIWEQDANGVHLRCPSIWCPIRSIIAKSVDFLSIDCAEDRVWAIQLYPLLSTQAYIDKHLYFYRSSTTETEAQREDRVDKSRKVISEFRYSPYIRSLTR
jgi:hypothetical protein